MKLKQIDLHQELVNLENQILSDNSYYLVKWQGRYFVSKPQLSLRDLVVFDYPGKNTTVWLTEVEELALIEE